MPHVVSLAYKPAELERRPPERFSRIAADRLTLIAGHGVAGDTKARSDSRQLNVMMAETVAQLQSEGFCTAPGEMGEQVVIAGLPIELAVPDVHLRVGDSAIVELVYFRVPCGRFERIQRQSKDVVRGRLGFMAKVLVGGDIAIGSPVTIERTVLDAAELAVPALPAAQPRRHR